jgi:hypothetical protein
MPPVSSAADEPTRTAAARTKVQMVGMTLPDVFDDWSQAEAILVQK